MKVEINPFPSPRVANFFAPDVRRLQGGPGAKPNTSGVGIIAPSAPVSCVVTVTTTRSGTTSGKLSTRIKAGNP